jgi:hypothetical protein
MPPRDNRDATEGKVRAVLSRDERRSGARTAQRGLAPSERELAEWFQALSNEEQDQWLRLVRLLSRAERRGDEFTWKRFDKLAGPGWDLSSVLRELERPVGRRMRAYC